MPSKRFTASMARLDDREKTIVSNQLAAWKSGNPSPDWAQIAENVENETALTPTKFAKLLGEFATGIRSAVSEPWIGACRGNKLQGRKLTSSETPAILGRMERLDNLISRAKPHGMYSRAILEDLLNEADGIEPAVVDPALPEILRAASLGKFLIWATFDERSPDQDPFRTFPVGATDCCTMLGLVEPAGATCILLHYESAPYLDETPPLDLHRPTVADAEDFALFRPRQGHADSFGKTHPTSPNSNNLAGCPEIVHREISGKGMIFPYRLAV